MKKSNKSMNKNKIMKKAKKMLPKSKKFGNVEYADSVKNNKERLTKDTII